MRLIHVTILYRLFRMQRLIRAVVVMVLLSSTSAIAQPFLPEHRDLFRPVFQVPGEYINDHSLILVGRRWHLYFIESKIGAWADAGSEVTIGHASSADLLSWELHPPALTIGPPGTLDAAHVYAPSVVERNGVYYMIYTGNEKGFDAGEHLLLATSTDLFTWKRYSAEPVVVPDSTWASYHPAGTAGGRGGPKSGRDPYIFHDTLSTARRYICYYVARMKADPARGRADGDFACIAAATSTDLIHWVDRGPVLARRTIGFDDYTWAHPESPCVVYYVNRYYLFWKSGSGMKYAISENPLDFSDRDQYVLSTSHASKIFQWKDQWYITSCSRDIDDIIHGDSDRKRGLFLAGIWWDDRHPTVVSLSDTLRMVTPR